MAATAISIKPTNITAFATLLHQPGHFDVWLETRRGDEVIAYRGNNRQSPVEIWLAENGFAVKVWPDISYTLAAQCQTPRWAAFLINKIAATAGPGTPVYVWDVRKLRRLFDRKLSVVGGRSWLS